MQRKLNRKDYTIIAEITGYSRIMVTQVLKEGIRENEFIEEAADEYIKFRDDMRKATSQKREEATQKRIAVLNKINEQRRAEKKLQQS